MEILIGADPEFFVRHKGKNRSAFGLIPGTKREPYPVNKGAVQVDGMALEFNIDPAKTEDEFVTNINTVIGEMRKMVKPDWEFVFDPTMTYHRNHLRVQPKEATELGCEPDYNAYTLAENPKPDADVNFRTASGHIHIGFTENAEASSEEHMMRCATLVRLLDVFLGLTSLAWDTDQKRRQLYGAPGAFRPKPYGVEYRVLSNAWLKDEARMRYVFQQVHKAFEAIRKGMRVNVEEQGRMEQMFQYAWLKQDRDRMLKTYDVTMPYHLKEMAQ